jgi:uncharacterized protein involved in exopolysaccharide biosynthesis
MTITAYTFPARGSRRGVPRAPGFATFIPGLRMATGGGSLGPYVLFGGMGILLIWMLATAYLLFMPPNYSSRWTFILPPSSNGASVSVETIGQTSTVASSPFSGVALSPKVIYREIIDSRGVITAAAASIGMKPEAFGRPRIKLVDETSLMNFEIAGSTAKQAQDKAQALIKAFNTQLEMLRNDELAKRASATEVHLKSYQQSVNVARERISELQRASGLLSLNQFSETATSLELLRRKAVEVKGDIEKMESQQAVLTGRVGIDPQDAALSLKIAADPAFTKLIADFAEINAKYADEQSRLGPQNPNLIHTATRRAGVSSEILAMAQHAGIDKRVNLQRLLLMVNGSHQAELLRQIVSNEAALTGRRDEMQSIGAEITLLDSETKRLSGAASNMEELRKDLIVAEAVFKSALARLDTNKTDIFQSYPIVQLLAQPEFPENRNQPRVTYALLGGTMGTLFVLLAMGLAWLQLTYGRKLTTSA